MSSLRNAGRVLSKIAVVEGINLPGPLVHFVRGIKPRWLPKSKSKIFYVRTPTPINPEESVQLRTEYFHHRTKLRAIRRFLIEQQAAKQKLVQAQSAIDDQDHAAEMLLMEEQNDQWNNRVNVIREEAVKKEEEKHQARIERVLEKNERRKAERMQKAEERLHQNLQESEKFITLDTLDFEIEKLLNVRQDYNFAIDKQGNKISDSDPVVDTSQQSDISQQQSAK